MAPWLVLLLWLFPAHAAPPPPRERPPAPERPPEATVRYAVETRGVAGRRFAAVAARVLGDPRGWSAGGRIRFQRVHRDADFTLYLAAPEQLPALGCWDTTYSCRSGDNVVINAARWADGTPAFAGPLRRYRTMVINHEVGHWLGFAHDDCRAAGARAPVMMQQSMGTGACRPNPWPLADERAMLLQRGLPPGGA